MKTTVYIRSRLDEDRSGFSDPWEAEFIEFPHHPRAGEQFITADDRAFRVETVEHYYDPEGNCVHLFCTEFPRESARGPRRGLRQRVMDAVMRDFKLDDIL